MLCGYLWHFKSMLITIRDIDGNTVEWLIFTCNNFP